MRKKSNIRSDMDNNNNNNNIHGNYDCAKKKRIKKKLSFFFLFIIIIIYICTREDRFVPIGRFTYPRACRVHF